MRKLLLIAVLVAALPLSAKSLYWDEMRVEAKLDADGVLHVREILTFVFDGDWNGGSRGFELGDRQVLGLNGVYRLEPGRAIPLEAGDLDAVDEYQLDGTMLRFRSRLPEDPPFANKAITYAIDYTITNVVAQPATGRWDLSHDFVFPQREGKIARFSLRLEFDPVWTGIQSPLVREATDLYPGTGFPVNVEFGRQAGAPAPAGMFVPPSKTARLGIAAVFLAALVLLCILFYVAEVPTGRFAKLLPPESINEEWLTGKVFFLRPEVIGAAWDGTVSAPEVAAVLARLTTEAKLKSRVEGKTLHMELLCHRGELSGYDRELVDKLFFDGSNTTDTERIRKRYQKTGFSPASVIEPGINLQLNNLHEWKTKVKRTRWAIHLPMLLISAGLLFWAGSSGDAVDAELLVRSTFFSIFFSVFVLIVAAVCSSALRFYFWVGVALAAPYAPIFINAMVALFSPAGYSLLALGAVCFTAVAIAALALDVLKISESRERIAYRKTLLAARQYLQKQLASANPALKDEWLPYLLALGLGRNVDQWFSTFSKPGSDDTLRRSSSSWSSSSSGSSSSGWTGGGGAFGGAGATGSWVAAATSVASGVAAPSSSSGGRSGGGGGGSRSGGGSGGGW